MAYAIAALAIATAAGCSQKRVTSDPVYFPPPPDPPHAVHLISFNALHEIVTPKSSWADLFRGGPVSPFVRRPAGVAYRNNRLYICDTGANVVHIWNLATGEAHRLGDREPLVLGEPVDVAVGDTGTVYVADTKRSEVVVFEGKVTRRITPRDQVGDNRTPQSRDRKEADDGKILHDASGNSVQYRPVALALNGQSLYVADIGAHRVDVFNVSTGDTLSTIGTVGSGNGQFYFPMGVATDAANRLYVSDSMNSRVQVFDPSHAFAFAVGEPGDRYGCLGKPRHLTVGPDGVLFVADPEFRYIHLFNRNGELLMLLGDPDEATAATPMPTGVAIALNLPKSLESLVPDDFNAAYYLFVTNAVGKKRISLYAIGTSKTLTRKRRPQE